MKLVQKYIVATLAVTASLGSQNGFAQQKYPNDSTSITQEIDVVKAYKPILSEAVKLRRSPNLNDQRQYKATPKFNFFDNRVEVNTEIRKLDAQDYTSVTQAIPSQNFARLGVGNLNTLFGELYLNAKTNEKSQLGGYLKHFSQTGKLEKQNMSHQQVGVFGKAIQENSTISGGIDYDRRAFNFYGYDPENTNFNRNKEAQNFNYLHGNVGIASNFTTDEDAFNYALKADAYTFSDKFSAKENDVLISGYLNKRISKFNLGLNASVQSGNTTTGDVIFKSTLLKVNPYIKLQADYLTVNAGINLVQESSSNKNRFMIFPAINANLIIVPEYFELFGEVKGDINRNSLKDLTDRNPFLNSNLQMQNVVNNLSISAGIKGTAGPGFGYKVMAFRKTITEMPLFLNSMSTPEKFDLVYDFGKSNILGIQGDISVQLSDVLNWTASLQLNKYNLAQEQYAWALPNVQLTSNLKYQVTKDFTFEASLYTQGDTKAKTYTHSNLEYANSVPIEKINTVKGFVDLGVGASYQINTKFGAFLRVNNLLNTKYSQYLYYPNVGLNVFGGVSYSF